MVSTSNKSRESSVELPFEASLEHLVRNTHRAFQRALQNRIAPSGVTLGMWWFLRILWEEDGLAQRPLSQRADMTDATAVKALSSMENAGIIRRVRDTEDRRRIKVFLTARGRALRHELLPIAAEINAVGLRGLSRQEVKQLLTLLRRIDVQLRALAISRNARKIASPRSRA